MKQPINKSKEKRINNEITLHQNDSNLEIDNPYDKSYKDFFETYESDVIYKIALPEKMKKDKKAKEECMEWIETMAKRILSMPNTEKCELKKMDYAL